KILSPLPPKKTDSLPLLKNKKVISKDTISDTTVINVADSFSIKGSKDSLDAPVVYHADDSMVLDVPTKIITLYGKTSNIKYSENDLSAPYIEYNQNTNLVKAHLEKDSTGKVIAFPAFNQGDFKSVIDTIVFDMKTGKGLTKGTYTQQGEMFVYAKTIKKIDKDVFYALNTRFTTCNLDTPHFAFVSHKVKFINKKMAFTGPVHPEFEGVPLPITLPFGIFPLAQGRHSGLLAPTFTANEQQGIALENIGYYRVLSDNWDVETRGTLYSYGGWTASIKPRYYKRYHYQGAFSLSLQKYKLLDEPANNTFAIAWNHSADTKARPGVTFTANVNASSSKYNSQIANDPVRNFNNQLTSTITYSKIWKDRPYSLSVSANHNQNTNLSYTNIILPDIAFNVNTLYPFRRKDPVGDLKWYENVGVALNSNAKSLSYFYDSLGHRPINEQIKDNLQYGANHSIPISLSLPPLGPFQVSPFISYSEQWFQRKDKYSFDNLNNKIDTTTSKGFFRAYDMSFGASFSTRIFGMFTFNKHSKIQAIRHEIRPSLSFSYHPDLNSKYWYTAKLDTLPLTKPASYSLFARNIYTGYSPNKSGSIGLNIDNNLSMKVRSKKDTGEAAVKKVSLIDGLSITTSYDLLADTFNLSPILISAHTNLLDKFNLTAGVSFDPYQVDNNFQRVNKLVLANRPSLGRLVTANIALQTSFKGGDKSKSSATPVLDPQNIDPRTGLPLDEYQQEAAYIRNNPGEYVDFSIPWSIDFSYSLLYTKSISQAINFLGYTKSVTQSINFNSSVNLTPKWKIGITGSYNISLRQLGYASMFLSRDLHCWQMAINIAPVGIYRFFSINISPKSPILRDLKVNRTRSFVDQ
ncbi:MAG: putative LPS assembly protein LptD, partial [Ferruginibacter sp.]